MKCLLVSLICVMSYTGEVKYYTFGVNTPRIVKLASVQATQAWEKQTGIKFVYINNFTKANFMIVFEKNYGMVDLDNKFIGIPGTIACAYVNNSEDYMSYIRINANKSDNYKYVLGDFGRYGKLVALTGVLMHELGHILGLPDISCNASQKDPLSNRDKWPTMYGRVWENKLQLKSEDFEILNRGRLEKDVLTYKPEI